MKYHHVLDKITQNILQNLTLVMTKKLTLQVINMLRNYWRQTMRANNF